MTQVFEFKNYKEYVSAWILEQPKGGHGQLKRMAEHLRSSPVVMTQIFRGDRELTPEQSLGVASFIGLSDAETEYFFLLVQRSRAGTHELTTLLDRQLAKAKENSTQIRNRIAHHTINEEAKALFYSSWIYSAVRLGLAIPGATNAKLSTAWGIEKRRLNEVSEFLLEHGLLKKSEAGYALGPAVIHVSHDHPLVERHHENWRMKGLDSVRQAQLSPKENLHYTGPMVLSAALAEEIKAELLKLVEQLTPKIQKAKNEKLFCLNIDWFRLH